MEFEQIIKRLEWLDEQHRNDSELIDSLSQRINSLEGDMKVANKKIKEASSQLAEFSTARARMDQFDESLASLRKELVLFVENMDVKQKEQQQEKNKSFSQQLTGMNKSITDLRKYKTTISNLSNELKALTEEENRRNKSFLEWENRMQVVLKDVESFQRTQRSMEEIHRQDTKRLADLQGELSAARKRLDDSREKQDLTRDQIRQIETRLNEFLANEAERKQAQMLFIETQSRNQVERDRIWKDWDEQHTGLNKIAETMSANLQSWESSQRMLKRAQDSYEEIIQKFERRINEITEMQRLAEDRFRQEWISFKADDQKRWTSFNLSQDELRKDALINTAKLEDKLMNIDDMTQTHQDILQQLKKANEEMLQGLLSQFHDLLSAYERMMNQ